MGPTETKVCGERDVEKTKKAPIKMDISIKFQEFLLLQHLRRLHSVREQRPKKFVLDWIDENRCCCDLAVSVPFFVFFDISSIGV